MKITEIVWDDETIEHIARHSVISSEVEEMFFGETHPFVEKGRENLYIVMGQTNTGRYIFTVVKLTGKGKAKIITAREMSDKDKKHYKRRMK